MTCHTHRRSSATATEPRSERGAVLVEFALTGLLLFGILFGIIDFGAVYAKTLDVRHGTSEGARLVAVNYKAPAHPNAVLDQQSADVINEICARMDGGSGADVTIRLNGTTAVGQSATVHITRPMTSLSGMFSNLLDNRTIEATVQVRIEDVATWARPEKPAVTGHCS